MQQESHNKQHRKQQHKKTQQKARSTKKEVTHRKVPYLLDSFSRHRMLVRIPGFCYKLFHLSQIADTQCHIAETKFPGIIQGWPTAHQDHAMKNHHWAIASRFWHFRCTSNDWMLQWQDVIALLIVAYQAYQVLPSPQAQKVSIFFKCMSWCVARITQSANKIFHPFHPNRINVSLIRWYLPANLT